MGVILEPLLWCIKYRPKNWDEFVGQESTISQLKSLVESNTLQNMIFYGPTGTGKSAAADVFSKSILGDSFDANFKSLNIRDIWFMSMTDAKRTVQDLAKLDRDERSELDEYMSVVYREATAALKSKGRTSPPNRSQLLQEAIRLFASTVTVTDEKIKILVLDEADALSYSMQQALRRTMELYSNACRFILITPSLSGWSPAVISRCTVLKFPLLQTDEIIAHLSDIAKKENVSLNNEASMAIARESEGDLRRAINLLQIAATSGSTITEDIVYIHSETTLNRTAREIVSLSIDGSYSDARKMIRGLVAIDGYDPQEVLLAIKRDLVKRPFTPFTLDKVLSRVAEIDYRIIQGKNSFVHLAALLASLRNYTTELT
ncbi:AAA family ATPase [Candidatus Thorarchaeota archaeon]|nr:MAG: AAA family ATPase [Candidatus Thorarchaeota archaeon]